MRALILSPDYASHYFPLSAVGRALERRGHEVIIATGPALAGRVRDDGFEHRELILGPGSNSGLLRASEQPVGEADGVADFLAATREGMIATLRYQADSRLRDLLWQPQEVTNGLSEIISDVKPTIVVSDQLSFGATLALRALNQPYISFHPGHPSAIPGPGELFGFPTLRPREFAASEAELSDLWRMCAETSARFTRVFNTMLHALNPQASPVPAALSVTSPLLTLLNYPADIGGYHRPLLPPSAQFVGASVRDVPTRENDVAGLLERSDVSHPRIYVSLGSFLSGRADVLRRIVSAFRERPVELVLASGVTPAWALGELPEAWHVRPTVSQPAVLDSCDLVISHGGNNTVTEALWAGVPLLVCPFSSDQFAGAEDVRRAGLGDVFDPNSASADEVAVRAEAVLASAAPERAARLAAKLRAHSGPDLSARLIEQAVSGDRLPETRRSRSSCELPRIKPHPPRRTPTEAA